MPDQGSRVFVCDPLASIQHLLEPDGTAVSGFMTAVMHPSFVTYMFEPQKPLFSTTLLSVFAGGDKTQAWGDLLCSTRPYLSTWFVHKEPRAPSVSSCNARKGHSAEHDQPPNLSHGCNAASQITTPPCGSNENVPCPCAAPHWHGGGLAPSDGLITVRL